MKPVPVRPVDVRFREKTGKHLLALSFSGFDTDSDIQHSRPEDEIGVPSFSRTSPFCLKQLYLTLRSTKHPSKDVTDYVDHSAECSMKSPDGESGSRRTPYFTEWIALFLMALGSGLPPAHADTFKFESKTSLYSYRATIGGELSFPQGGGPFPVVILLHACGGLHQLEKASLSAQARSLTKVGFATYILDSFSARGLTADDICDGPKGREASEFRLDDLFNAREALQKLPKVDKNKFFAVGQSHGATVALWAQQFSIWHRT
jgi:hypothetical protein